MKKLLILPLLWTSVLIAGCGNQNNIENPNTTIDLQKSEICSDNKWTLTNWAEWWDITVCAFDDGSFCFLEDLESKICEKWLVFFEDSNDTKIDDEVDNTEALNINESEESEDVECDQLKENIVCWKDWNTYKNRCYLNEAWVEEEVELAHVENWECVFE